MLPFPTTLNDFLVDVHRRHLTVRKIEFQAHYNEISKVLNKLLERINVNASYKSRDTSQLPHDPDMDTKNLSSTVSKYLCNDVEIHPKRPGFVWLRAGPKYFDLPSDKHCDVDHFPRHWVDHEGYLLRTMFLSWFNSVIDQTLNQLTTHGENYQFTVENQCYEILKSVNHIGCTLTIACHKFCFDVDLLPALKFPESRWPPGPGYRRIPASCRAGHWMVVPKGRYGFNMPNAARNWQVVLITQETRFLHNHRHLHQTFNLLKTVRNNLNLKKITNYHLKTLFLWETLRTKIDFWDQDLDFLFKTMIWRLCDAIHYGRILFFWNKKNNTIRNLNTKTRIDYEKTLRMLIYVMEEPETLDDLAHLMLRRVDYAKLYKRSKYRTKRQPMYGRVFKYAYVDYV